MSDIKRLRLLLPILIGLFVFSFSPYCYAHGGRTDSKGGHRDSSTGDYHYHHGYPAHDHTDLDGDGDLDCPYSFSDITEHGEGLHEATAKPTHVNSNKGSTPKPVLYIFGGAAFTLMFCTPFILNDK